MNLLALATGGRLSPAGSGGAIERVSVSLTTTAATAKLVKTTFSTSIVGGPVSARTADTAKMAEIKTPKITAEIKCG